MPDEFDDAAIPPPTHPFTPSSRHSTPRSEPRPLILGLVGGIGSGKSSVAREFVKRGGFLIDGDALGHEALRREEIKAKIVKQWGEDVLDEDGRVDRRKLGGIVFGDVRELRTLEGLVFPFLGQRMREEIARAATAPFIIVDAAVMMEAGWDQNCDRIIFVDAPQAMRHERVAAQRGWSPADVEVRQRTQLPLEEKRRRADFVLDNAGPPERITARIDAILAEMGIKQSTPRIH